MAWSAFLIWIIAKLRSDNYAKPLFTELANPPIAMAAVIAIAVTYFTFEPISTSGPKDIIALINGPIGVIKSLVCNFNTTLNVLSLVLPLITIYSFIDKNHPDIIINFKDKIREFFQ